jgi:hypothetical protein
MNFRDSGRVLWGRMNLQPIQQPARLGRRKRLVQTGAAVVIEVVHHQANYLDAGIMNVYQLFAERRANLDGIPIT